MDLFLIAVIALFGLAIADLVVGVSNDAVNFLNSAVGSKVAPRKIIMIVATLGILVGATFSSGMMEVARKGVFVPSYFQFDEIMILFLAVMITDIILLDLFNTFGLPTSTTVSIVFELLGASTILAFLKTSVPGYDISLAAHINSSSALLIISGIFLSVAIAFTIGAMVQYVSRLLLTFHYQKNLRFIGAAWAGLAMSFMLHFLIVKGAKGASFIPLSFVAWTEGHSTLLLAILFVSLTIIFFIVHAALKWNYLRFVVLFGTFALAMSFAGNDLVNFIGVPVAGFESYRAWATTGVEANDYNMAILGQAYRTPTLLLLLAGVIMALTLWFSKKARSVTETEVNLGRQGETLERFSPNGLSVSVVRFVFWFGNQFLAILPDSWKAFAEKRFESVPQEREKPKDEAPPAFDLVRASVNLGVASMLISLATSYKLPLSTTYVSFMVAMGTSWSDRAWGRDSAVYRVAGVFNVIGGWFATALIAFTVSGTFAFLIWYFKLPALILLLFTAMALIYRTFRLHKSREKKAAELRKMHFQQNELSVQEFVSRAAKDISHTLDIIQEELFEAYQGLLDEDRSRLKKAQKKLRTIADKNTEFQNSFYSYITRMSEEETEGSRTFIQLTDLEQDILQSINFIVDACYNHVSRIHEAPHHQQFEKLKILQEEGQDYFKTVGVFLRNEDGVDYTTLLHKEQTLLTDLEKGIAMQVEGIKSRTYSPRNSYLILSILLESKDLVIGASRIAKLLERMQPQTREPWLLFGERT